MAKKTNRGRYRGELRTRFNIIEQWDGKKWREPPEVGDYGKSLAPIHFDVTDALRDDDDPFERHARPR